MRKKQNEEEKNAVDPEMEAILSELLTELKSASVPPRVGKLAEELQRKLDQRLNRLN